MSTRILTVDPELSAWPSGFKDVVNGLGVKEVISLSKSYLVLCILKSLSLRSFGSVGCLDYRSLWQLFSVSQSVEPPVIILSLGSLGSFLVFFISLPLFLLMHSL